MISFNNVSNYYCIFIVNQKGHIYKLNFNKSILNFINKYETTKFNKIYSILYINEFSFLAGDDNG